jgi:hypothetical protein
MALTNTGGECSGFPMPDVRIPEPPRSGTITVRYGLSTFPANAPQCAGRQVPGLGVFYRPNTGFTGLDRVRIESGAPGQPSQGGQTFNLAVTQWRQNPHDAPRARSIRFAVAGVLMRMSGCYINPKGRQKSGRKACPSR